MSDPLSTEEYLRQKKELRSKEDALRSRLSSSQHGIVITTDRETKFAVEDVFRTEEIAPPERMWKGYSSDVKTNNPPDVIVLHYDGTPVSLELISNVEVWALDIPVYVLGLGTCRTITQKVRASLADVVMAAATWSANELQRHPLHPSQTTALEKLQKEIRDAAAAAADRMHVCEGIDQILSEQKSAGRIPDEDVTTYRSDRHRRTNQGRSRDQLHAYEGVLDDGDADSTVDGGPNQEQCLVQQATVSSIIDQLKNKRKALAVIGINTYPADSTEIRLDKLAGLHVAATTRTLIKKSRETI